MAKLLGQRVPSKVVAEVLGRAAVAITLDRYSHGRWRCTRKLWTPSKGPCGSLSLSQLAQRLNYNLETLRSNRSHLISYADVEGWQSG